MKSAVVHPYQIENHLIDDGFYWSKVGEIGWTNLVSLVDPALGPLWENGSSSYSGYNDRVDEDRAAKAVLTFGGSLCLIRVNDLTVRVAVEGAEFNNAKRRVRGEFSYSGHRYRVAITDPVAGNAYLAQGDGNYAVGDSLLCLSLGDAYGGFAYKLIAAVFFPPIVP